MEIREARADTLSQLQAVISDLRLLGASIEILGLDDCNVICAAAAVSSSGPVCSGLTAADVAAQNWPRKGSVTQHAVAEASTRQTPGFPTREAQLREPIRFPQKVSLECGLFLFSFVKGCLESESN